MSQEIARGDVAAARDLRATFGSIIANACANIAAKRPGRRRDPNSARSCKPWLAAGISERTYYRRKADETVGNPISDVDEPTQKPRAQQHDAHAVAWLATLSSMHRLEYKAYARRCVIEARFV